MKFTLEFDMDNDAFTGHRVTAEVLTMIAAKVRRGYQCGIVSDINGNTIGRFQIGDE